MPDSSQYRLASIQKRILSAIIDFILFCVLLTFLGFFFGESERGKINPDGSIVQFGFALNGAMVLIVFIIWILIFPVLEGLTGYTLAKKILGLKTVKKDYKKTTILNSCVRHLFDPIDIFLFLGFIIASNNKNKQRIGDLVANTIVVDEKSNI